MRFFFTIFTCLFLIPFSTFSQEIEWVKHLRESASNPYGSGVEQYAKKVLITADKGLLVCGSYDGSMDFDPGVSEDIVTSTSSQYDGFIVKLDSLGDFEWKVRVSAVTRSVIEDITEDDLGNIYCTGYVFGAGTLDKGGANIGIGSGGAFTAYVMAINSNGVYQWSQVFNNVTGAHSSTGYEILVVNNKLFLTGHFSGTMNVNPAGTPVLLSESNGSNYLICLDTNSTYNWHYQNFNNVDDGRTLTADALGNVYYSYIASNTYLKKFDLSGNVLLNVDWGGGNAFVIEDVAIDQDGGIYLTGYGEGGFIPQYDLAPGPDVFLVPPGIFYARLDQYGTFYSGEGLGGSMYNDLLLSKGSGISLDYQKNIYVTGKSRVGGISGNNSIFINKYDTLGNQLWSYSLGAQGDDYGTDIVVNDNLDIFTVGAFDCTVDFDPSSITSQFLTTDYYFCSGTDSEDGFILKWSQDSCDHLGIIIDTIIGSTCVSSGFVEAHGVNSPGPFLYSWDGGPYGPTSSFSPLSGGNHTLTVRASNLCEKTREFYVPGPAQVGVDAQINSTVRWVYAPDVYGKITIDAFNSGCSMSSGEIAIVLPQNLIYDSASVAPDFILGDTLIWNYNNYDYQTPHFISDIYYTGDTLIQLGDTLCYSTWITPLMDDDTTNNYKTYCQLAQASYDPNEKYVYPIGECVPNYIDTAQRLTYTVQFQNTGSTEALNVYILDTISSSLDLMSLEVVATSHTMITEILPGGVLKFRFDDIHLPDSTSNFEMSSGYVIFEISQKDTLPNNTEITNSAAIYFDYNAPVFTSVVLNTVVDNVPSESYSYMAQTACDSLSVSGSVYYSSGTFPLLLSTMFGCDSTIVLDVTINQSSESFLNESVCDQFTIGGVTYTSGGMYDQYLVNSVGCDSLVHLDLIVQNTSSTQILDTCSGVDLNGINYTSSGVYTQVIPNSVGCDSTITYDLTIYDTDSTLSLVGCDTVELNGVSYTTTGSYQQVLASVAGCDSILTLDVGIDYSTVVPINEVACEEFILSGVSYQNTGNYYQYYTNSVGCDSILALDLIIGQDSETFLDSVGIDSLIINSITYDTSGVYIQYLTTVAGCDSILNLNLSIGYTDLTELERVIKLSPNPTSSSVIITGDIVGVKFRVVDGLGRIQKVQISEEFDQIEVDLSNLSNGIYYISSDLYKPHSVVKN